jgi:hypothetical protein
MAGAIIRRKGLTLQAFPVTLHACADLMFSLRAQYKYS